MPDVLNPYLYGRLKRHFRNVRISNDGQAMVATAVRSGINNEPRLSIAHAGEYYQVSCPFCNDTRFRLYINHMYGQKDAFGRRMKFLAVCYNDTACMSKPANQEEFWERLNEMEDEIERATIYQGDIVPEEAQEINWPGPCTRLDDLPDDHPARLYLEARSFDPDKIARVYGVAYCHDSHYYTARNRIIIPVFERGKLKGWQARHIGELNWKDKTKNHPPKYFTYPGMPRRVLLYNLDNAKKYSTGIVVEGPTDVWSVGPMAVCTFGSTMTPQQRSRFKTVFRRRTAILLYDPEAFASAATRSLVAYFKKHMPGRFAAIKLPEGTDPGSLDREFLRDYVTEKAARRGVEISFKKWEG